MYILESMPLIAMCITDLERWEWYKTRAKKASLKAPTGIQVQQREDGETQETEPPNHLTWFLTACWRMKSLEW